MKKATQLSNFRQAHILYGEQSWGITTAHSFFQRYQTPSEAILCITQASFELGLCVPANKAQTILGQAFDVFVFDAHSGFDVNALAAALGTLRGGGVLLLLMPLQWKTWHDPAYQRFIPHGYDIPQESMFLKRLMRDLPADLFQVHQQGEIFKLPPITISQLSDQTWKWTADQQSALASLQSFEGVSLLLADRGRGKSTLLGESLCIWQSQGHKVLITAPKRSATLSLFEQAQCETDCFVAPDKLLLSQARADILIVDEAAAIPIPMLLQMLKNNKKVVFSTTVQGYEGSGRGFLLKFRKLLKKSDVAWQQINLYQPVRWAAHDPLEQWLNQALLLDLVLPKIGVVTQYEYQHITAQHLLNDEKLLQQIFSLLVAAHYQTRPSDLRQILDAPNISTHVLKSPEQIIAVALVSQEGGLGIELTEQVFQGKRRPQGHLVPQTLTCHAQIPQAATLSCERVMRIAVHPDCQQKGLGQKLLAHIKAYAQAKQTDYLATSYAATAWLIKFWKQAGYQVVRVGFKRDRASGAHAIVQIHALSQKGQVLEQQAVEKFQASLPELLQTSLQDLESDIRATLART